MDLKPVTVFNIFVKQQYICHKCNNVGKFDFEHIQLFGKLIKKPWRTIKRPNQCSKCGAKMEYGWGQGRNAWVDDWSGVWRFWILVILSFVGIFIFLAKYYDIQIFEELAKLIFGNVYEINPKE